jgi:hypothetical protein
LGAGAGTWGSGFTAVNCLVLAGFGYFLGEKNITKGDWISLILSLGIIPIWAFTRDPLGAVILALVIDIIGCYPTVRKSYTAPYTENVFTWSVNSIRFLFSFFAIEQYSLVAVIFPLGIFLINSSITLLLVIRRRVQGRARFAS